MTYDELKAGIDAAPITYVPALLIAVVRRAVRDKVFADGGLLKVVERATAAEEEGR